jgi:hypothetical protein
MHEGIPTGLIIETSDKSRRLPLGQYEIEPRHGTSAESMNGRFSTDNDHQIPHCIKELPAFGNSSRDHGRIPRLAPHREVLEPCRSSYRPSDLE